MAAALQVSLTFFVPLLWSVFTNFFYSFSLEGQLIRQNRELQETLKCFMDQFEELRSLYLNVQSKFDLMKENNRDLAFKYACATHENELLKSRLDQISKEQFIKISSFKRVSLS